MPHLIEVLHMPYHLAIGICIANLSIGISSWNYRCSDLYLSSTWSYIKI